MREDPSSGARPGPLSGLRLVEFAGIGPGPFAAMLLADMGADIVRIERPDPPPFAPGPIVGRGRRTVAIDLKAEASRPALLALIDRADGLIEGFRPGVMERLGLGPDLLLARNPRLVYGRMTGWGQEGPLARAVGHDINYIAITGALAAIGPAEQPLPPLNLVGDYGGGALYLVAGLLAALWEAGRSGQGQVVDAAICDGAASLMAMFLDLGAAGHWRDGARAANLLDGGAPFYATYECADGRFIAIGALEETFYDRLRALAGLDDPAFDGRHDPANWPDLRTRMAAIFRRKSQAEWCRLLEGSDACVAPVLTLTEAPTHPHLKARDTFIDSDTGPAPAPAPRFSRTPSAAGRPSEPADLAVILSSWDAPASSGGL